MSHTYFKGLNSLRFLAAAFVVLRHIPEHQYNVGLPHLYSYPFLLKGAEAVNFFFMLSGFLITYLLIEEHQATGTIQIKKFYIRRTLRIWPLYFLIVGIGLVTYFLVLPSIGINHKIDFSISTAIVLYVLFLPHAMSSFYGVGGILNITWSIGVEEQFYLLWAPVVKYFYKNILLICSIVFIVFLAIHHLTSYYLTDLFIPVGVLVLHLNFHYMALGGIAAYFLYHHRNHLLNSWIFSSIISQIICIGLLISYFFIYKNQFRFQFYHEIILALLYSWLIINVSSNEKSFFKFNNPVLEWLGSISYGIYMYHMISIYLISFFFKKTQFLVNHFFLFNLSYYLFVFGLTIFLAYVSYQFFEKKFLYLKSKFEVI